MLDSLAHLTGSEHAFSEVAAELRRAARTSGLGAAGAFHVSCSDESEFEATDAFRRDFAQETLPRLKYGSHVPFRIANPGARYEWGSTAIAEDHFTTDAARRGGLFMVVKINTHVAVTRSGEGGLAFGHMERYGAPSTYCGAVGAVLGGGSGLPFVRDLEAELRSDGLDRVTILREADGFDAGLAPLYGALACARLHARRVVQDVQDGTHAVPCMYVVIHGVTLNRSGMDTELIGGVYLLDRTGETPDDRYVGVGDDPRAYRFAEHGGKVQVTDDGCETPRAVRNHRALAAERLAAMGEDLTHPQVESAVNAARQAPPTSPARSLLKPALVALAEFTPIPAALWLFAEGLVGVHHAVRVNRAGSADHQREAARDIVSEFQEQVDAMSPEEARAVLERLQTAAAG